MPTMMANEWIAATLVALIAVHVAAALYHRYIRKGELLRRMGFGTWD